MTTIRICLTTAAMMLSTALAAGPAQAAGLDIHRNADAGEVGLPLYPGATKDTSKEDEHGGLSLGLWGGEFGFKLVAVSYVSGDGVEAVARFYREALSKYGPVLDCSQAKSARRGSSASGVSLSFDSDKGSADKPLTCGDDGPDVAGGRLYKVGTRSDQRLFELKPNGTGVGFELVHLQIRGAD